MKRPRTTAQPPRSRRNVRTLALAAARAAAPLRAVEGAIDPVDQVVGVVADVQQVGPDCLEVHFVSQGAGEGVDGAVRVVPRPVEATVHRELHPTTDRLEERRDRESGARHGH